MSLFDIFRSLFGDLDETGVAPQVSADTNLSDQSTLGQDINPATGLPMTNGIGSVDVAGNPYGTNLSELASTNDSYPGGAASSTASIGESGLWDSGNNDFGSPLDP